MEDFRLNWQLIGLLMVSGQALLFALILLLQRRGNRQANAVLSLLVLILLWHHLDFIINTSFWYQVFPYLYTPHYVSWFLLGPLVFLYIKYLLQPQYRMEVWVKLSFLPAAMAMVNYFGLYTMESGAKVEMIRQTVILNQSALGDFFEPVIQGSVVFTAQLLVFAIFLGAGIHALRQPRQSSSSPQQNEPDIRTRWLYFVLVTFAIAATVANFFMRAIWISPIQGLSDSIYLSIAPFTLFLVILETGAFLHPEVYTGVSVFSSLKGRVEKYTNSSLNEEEVAAIVARLKNFMVSERPFLDSELRINRLSKELDVPVNHLSQVINQELNKNFSEFVNSYRVEEARKIIAAQKHCKLNLLEVALEVGFNNKTSFLNAFKKNLQMSPSSYKKSLLIETG